LVRFFIRQTREISEVHIPHLGVQQIWLHLHHSFSKPKNHN